MFGPPPIAARSVQQSDPVWTPALQRAQPAGFKYPESRPRVRGPPARSTPSGSSGFIHVLEGPGRVVRHVDPPAPELRARAGCPNAGSCPPSRSRRARRRGRPRTRAVGGRGPSRSRCGSPRSARRAPSGPPWTPGGAGRPWSPAAARGASASPSTASATPASSSTGWSMSSLDHSTIRWMSCRGDPFPGDLDRRLDHGEGEGLHPVAEQGRGSGVPPPSGGASASASSSRPGREQVDQPLGGRHEVGLGVPEGVVAVESRSPVMPTRHCRTVPPGYRVPRAADPGAARVAAPKVLLHDHLDGGRAALHDGRAGGGVRLRRAAQHRPRGAGRPGAPGGQPAGPGAVPADLRPHRGA